MCRKCHEPFLQLFQASKTQSSREPLTPCLRGSTELRGILIGIREQDEGAKGPRTAMLHWETLQFRLAQSHAGTDPRLVQERFGTLEQLRIAAIM